MTPPDPLTEAVARAIAAIDGHVFDYMADHLQHMMRARATAALAIARPAIRRETLEEARKLVHLAQFDKPLRPYSDIADDIAALMENPDDPR